MPDNNLNQNKGQQEKGVAVIFFDEFDALPPREPSSIEASEAMKALFAELPYSPSPNAFPQTVRGRWCHEYYATLFGLNCQIHNLSSAPERAAELVHHWKEVAQTTLNGTEAAEIIAKIEQDIATIDSFRRQEGEQLRAACEGLCERIGVETTDLERQFWSNNLNYHLFQDEQPVYVGSGANKIREVFEAARRIRDGLNKES